MKDITKNETKRERTPAQRAAFSKAKLKGGLTTMSPRKRNEQKIKDLLGALHGWGFSTSKILARACGCAGTSFISGAAKAGLVRYELILGRQYVLLTRRGLDLLKSMTDPDDLVAVERANLGLVQTVGLHTFCHDGYAQKIFAEKWVWQFAMNCHTSGCLNATCGRGTRIKKTSYRTAQRCLMVHFFAKAF